VCRPHTNAGGAGPDLRVRSPRAAFVCWAHTNPCARLPDLRVRSLLAEFACNLHTSASVAATGYQRLRTSSAPLVKRCSSAKPNAS